MNSKKNSSGSCRIIFINSAGEHSSEAFCGRCAHSVFDSESGKRIFPGLDNEAKPICAKFDLGSPLNWQGHCGIYFRDELLALNLWKCQMNYWLLIEGVEQ